MGAAKSQLSRLGRLAWEGEEVVIAKAGEQYLRLESYRRTSRRHRTLGVFEGQVEVAPDFDDAPRDIVDSFYDSELDPPLR